VEEFCRKIIDSRSERRNKWVEMYMI
jgi:hypothetical protein